MIKAAPWSFAIVCAVTIAACFGGFNWYYREKLEDSESRVQRWKSDADYWKDKATQPPKVVTNNPPPVPVPDTLPRKGVKERLKAASSLGSSKYGGVTAQPGGVVSIEQEGGITAGQVTINPSVDYVEPNASIRWLLSSSLAGVRAKYSDRDINVIVAPEAGSHQRRLVSQFLGNILKEHNLGRFSDSTFVGNYPDDPVTAVCTSHDTDIANDLLDALTAYMPRGVVKVDERIKTTPVTMELYIYGSPTFRKDGYLVFK